MDKAHALDSFWEYVGAYDQENPRIALKVDHTLRVADLCERIARDEGMPACDVDLAWLLGLLHDIGRFEQVRLYDTFTDAASVSHARLGASVLFEHANVTGGPLVRRFLRDRAHDDLVRLAIATHSDYRLPAGLDERTRSLCDVLRDADKIDIIHANCICPVEDIYGVSEGMMRASRLSDECVEIFYQHRCLPHGVRRHPADILLGHICFAWELVYPRSLAIVREQGHLADMLSRTWDLPQTQEGFDRMADHMRSELAV